MLQIKYGRNLFLSSVFLFMFSGFVSAQVDSTATKQDTTKKTDKKKHKKNSFIIYGGANMNDLGISSGSMYESDPELGAHAGVAYKSGGFFYWQFGARYNAAKYSVKLVNGADTAENFTVSSLDLPITGGISFLSFMNRVGSVRVFAAAMPSFGLKVSDNPLGITKDDINTFNFYGQVGLGIDILFLVIEAGYNHGFADVLKSEKSNPGQVFVNVGFRF